jgi:oligoribonuclease NrnB/cAMP/cGMP phosphodiesterase (DHH superfamily)
MKCFYHNDLDGHCAAFWVHLSVGVKDSSIPADFIEINYNIAFPFDKILPNEQIWIVDYSITPAEMKRLLTITKDITWIDHHKTAIEKYRDFPEEIRGIRKDGLAGCELTFLYIHRLTARGGGTIKELTKDDIDEIPLFTAMVGDWDVWRFSHGREQVTNFKTGIEMGNNTPESPIWYGLLIDKDHTLLEKLINKGKNGLLFQKYLAKRLLASWSFPVEFEGYKCIALNAGSCNSDYFESVEKDFDVYMPYVFDGKLWTVSLYTKREDIDVSEIAKKYGGGGHKQASGFQCEKLPFIH